MRRASTTWVLAIGLVLFSNGLVQAQFRPPTGVGGFGGGFGGGGIGGPGSYPVFSPYLNLFRGDQSLMLNYWGLVQPQVAFQQAIGGLQQDVQGLAGQAVNAQLASMQSQYGFIPPTGMIPAGFQTQRLYFMNFRGSGGAGGGFGGGMGGGAGGPGGMGLTGGPGGTGMGMGGPMGMGMGGFGGGMGGFGGGMGGMGTGGFGGYR
jgi:hypothetical protein